MKTKKLITALAFLLGLSAFAGCSGDKTVTLDNYWDYTSLSEGQSIDETLVYGVTFEASSSSLVDYSLAYTNGVYTTTLKTDTLNGERIYRYTTKLDIDVTFTLNETDSVTEHDSIATEVVFYDADHSIRPISSKKTIASSTPLNANSVTSAKDCYLDVDYEIVTNYDENGKGTCVISANGAELSDTFEMGSKYTYLDNEQLLFALRGFSSSTTSASVKTYTPFVQNLQEVKITFSDAKEDEARKFTISENGAEATQKAIPYRKASVVLNDKNPGATQSAWIATASDTNNNTNRNVMLHLETPLSYNLGTLVYDIKTITRS